MSQPDSAVDQPVPPWVFARTVLRCRRGAIALAFLLTLAPLLHLSWKKGQPTYVSEAAIHVAARFPKMLTDDPEVQAAALNYANFLQQQVYVITRFEVVEDALQRLGDRRALWQQPDETDSQAVERLRASLEVEAVQGSYLVTVALSGDAPDGLAEIVNAVVESYMDVQRGENIYAPTRRVAELTEYRQEIEQQIAEKVAEKSNLAQELGVPHFERASDNPYGTSLIETRTAVAAARRELVAARLDLAGLDEEQEQALDLEVDSEAQLLISAAEDAEDPLVLRLTELQASTVGLTPNHPGYEAALAEIENIRNVLERRAEAQTQRMAELLDRRRRTEATRARLAAEGLVDRTEKKLAALEADYELLSERVADFVTRFARGRHLEEEIIRHQQKIAAIEERISFLTVESEAPGFSRLASPARTPEQPERERWLLYAGASVIVALFVGLGFGVLRELVDTRIRTPADVRRAAGFAPLGWIAVKDDRRTRTRVDDQFRRLALTIERERRNSGTHSFVITSPRHDKSKHDFTLRLGKALSELHLDALTVDANAATADGGDGEPGLLDLLRGSAEAASTIARGMPDHLPLGTGPEEEHLPESHRIGTVLGLLAEEYDVILIEAPALATSSDADLLVSCCDATLLLVQARAETADDVIGAVRSLERVAPSAVGVVLNGVDPRIPQSAPAPSRSLPGTADPVGDPLLADSPTA